MKIRYISNIALMVLLLIVDLVWVAFSPVYFDMGTSGLGLLAFITYQIISYSAVFSLWVCIFLVEFVIYKTKLLKQLEINIKDKRLSGIILISPVIVVLLTVSLTIVGEKFKQPIYNKSIQYEQNIPIEKSYFYKENKTTRKLD
jgi:hypothetical protein